MKNILRATPKEGALAHLEEIARLRLQLTEVRAAYQRLEAEAEALRDLLDGNIPKAAMYLMAKVARQRDHLDYLERRQLLALTILRAHARRGWILRRQEWLEMRAGLPPELIARLPAKAQEDIPTSDTV